MAKVVVLGEDPDDSWWKKRPKNRADAGKNKDESGCKKCDFGPWGLLTNRTEIRFCKRKGCNSSEERPHSCARNRCLLHPDNQ
jgi:hypothetical protein